MFQLSEAQIPFYSVYVEVGAQGEAMRREEGEEVLALGGGGGAGFGAFEEGEVGEGAVEEPQGAAAGAR